MQSANQLRSHRSQACNDMSVKGSAVSIQLKQNSGTDTVHSRLVWKRSFRIKRCPPYPHMMQVAKITFWAVFIW
ncbi:protein of unknown function [Azospirillum lipoferum 4B]|uniref:Uncharacterized protein n=1 Tax=Azospirillum lipoferum (strain 4B) TaxID=862719 RepID=G7Z4S8_AZOL4|nr:protein of unknown function [Azospirillum lipoferum 4B]